MFLERSVNSFLGYSSPTIPDKYLEQNKKPSEIGQNYKILISIFVYLLNALARFNFWKGHW